MKDVQRQGLEARFHKIIESIGMSNEEAESRMAFYGQSKDSIASYMKNGKKSVWGKATVVSYILIEQGFGCGCCGEKNHYDENGNVDGYVNLQVHHIDGQPKNNVPENIQMLCYNCHGDTPFWGKGVDKIDVPREAVIAAIPLCYNPNHCQNFLGYKQPCNDQADKIMKIKNEEGLFFKGEKVRNFNQFMNV